MYKNIKNKKDLIHGIRTQLDYLNTQNEVNLKSKHKTDFFIEYLYYLIR